MDTTFKNLFLLIFLSLITISCQTKNTNAGLGFLEIDVTGNYPEKEILLDDIAELEYVSPEFEEDYLFSGSPWVVTENHMAFFNRSSGDILLYTRKGRPVGRMNNRGEGPGEYNNMIRTILLDDNNEEVIVLNGNNILFYSFDGIHKRTLTLPANLNRIVEFDDNYFMGYDRTEGYASPFILISRHSGEIFEEIPIPYDKKIQLYVMKSDGGNVFVMMGVICNIVKSHDGFLLIEHSSDTIYSYDYEHRLTPALVRQPSIQEMDPLVYLNGYVETNRFKFMTTIRLEYDWDVRSGFQQANLMLDKETGVIYRQCIKWNDYAGKEILILPEQLNETNNSRVGLITLSLAELQEANEEGKLKGKLKELVESLDEDGNDILLFMHFK